MLDCTHMAWLVMLCAAMAAEAFLLVDFCSRRSVCMRWTWCFVCERRRPPTNLALRRAKAVVATHPAANTAVVLKTCRE